MLRVGFAAPTTRAMFGGGQMSPGGTYDWRRRRPGRRGGVDDMRWCRVLETTLLDWTVLARAISARFSWEDMS